MKLVEKNLNGFGAIGIVAVVAVLVVLAAGGYFAYQRFSQKAAPPSVNSFEDCIKAGYPVAGGVTPSFCVTPDGRRFVEKVDEGDKACTQEVKLCPDGSYVGRTGPNCEFQECPHGSDIIFGKEAENLCGPQPPAICQAGKRLGCDRRTKHWDCYPMLEEIDILDWKTYRNEKYGFEVRYPGYLIEKLKHDGITLFWEEPVLATEYTNLSISVDPNPQGLNMMEFYDGDPGEDLYGSTKKEDIVDIIVGGRHAVKFDPYITLGGGEEMTIPFRGDFIRIFDNGGSFRHSGLLQKFLSTFKFVDKSSTSTGDYSKINPISGVRVSLNKANFVSEGDKILVEVKNTSNKQIEYAQSLCGEVIFGGKLQKWDENKNVWDTVRVGPCFPEISPQTLEPGEMLREELNVYTIFSKLGSGNFRFIFPDQSVATFSITK